ncbi:MAG: type I-B CRISPR-associated endonuclease Cas1b [Peptococcaceae bacterium]|jgi:CRISPR-associated protein Cas1|nr:type I-B CRISPR-associated endonuclease Cas1b [Peptococcaceae bacterium]
MKKSLYVFSEGELKRKDNTLVFETQAGKRYLPVEDTKEIMAFGEVSFNKSLLEFISQKEILIHYFNHFGYYMGTFYPREHLNSGYMILKQAEHYQHPEKRLLIARAFVKGAYRNIRQVLKYYHNRGRELGELISLIENLGQGIEDCQEISQLMALEGHIREHYYHGFDIIINNRDFRFQERTRRPPKNFLNVLISFGNSIIYSMMLSEVYKTHLDPRIGFLHATNFRRFTLNLDVAEIFKPIIIDRLIFSLLDKNMITKDDFEHQVEGLLLKEKGKRVFVEELDRKLETTINIKSLGRNVSYRRLFRLELYKLEKHLMGEKVYEPFVASW